MRNAFASLPIILLCSLFAPAGRLLAADNTNAPHPSRMAGGANAPAGKSIPRASTVLVSPLRYTLPIKIPRLSGDPTLSDFLMPHSDSAVVREMVRQSKFIQRYPEDGRPVTEPTTAYMGYTHEYFYIAFVCQDSTPNAIRAHMLARDSLGDDDFVEVILDTFHDQRRAFVFKSNALGIQADALYSEQNGSDYSFDTVWDTWGKRTADGYTILMRIPFTSLYFKKAGLNETRTWGIVLERNISHTDESSYWPEVKHNVAGRLTQEIAIQGFSNVEHGRNLQFEPYTLARNLRQLNTENPINPYFQDKHLQGYAGLDAKFILHNSLVLDTTINPDFSQVGINNPAAPNQRFRPFFPEVRPFFIENSSYFMTPISLYYTNNIVLPKYGARLTGKLGPWALGILDVDDLSPGQSVPAGNPEYNTKANFYLARVNRDVGKLSNIGIIYADREYQDSFNRAGGLDYRARVRNRWTVTGQAITSNTKNLSNIPQGEQSCELGTLTCSGQVYQQAVSYADLHKSWWLSYNDTSSGFVTDTGFFRRADVRQPSGGFSYTFRPSHGIILSHGPSVFSERIWDHRGVPLDFHINPSYSLSFQDRTSISANVSIGEDRLRPVDFSILKQDVEYQNHTEGISFYTSPKPYLAFGGGAYAGTVINYSPPASSAPDPVNVSSPNATLELKPFNALDLQSSFTYTHFTNPDNGDLVYDNEQWISRWNYQATKAVSLNLIGQFISTLPNSTYTSLTNSKTLFADALLTYLPHPGTAIYLGYIGNFANIDSALCTRDSDGLCNTSDPILPSTNSSMLNDGKTIYMKITYLLHF